jgi:hypothetical protein
MFIIFSVMCFLGAAQFYLTYPETCNKTLEEIEEMFSPTGPRPWHTKPGESKLDALVDEAREKHYTIEDILHRNLGSKVVESVSHEQGSVSQEH